MAYFSKLEASQILSNEISVEALLQKYPEYKEAVLDELAALKSNQGSKLIEAIIVKYTSNAKMASSKIHKSGMNEKTIDAFLPVVIKARFAIYLLEQTNIAVAATSQNTVKPLRLNLWDGTILQKLLFKQGLERKPVALSAFKLGWRLVIHKKRLMPLVNQKGIYCFYSKPLINELSGLIGDKRCLEIGAGDGTLSLFLKEGHVCCIATDDYSWEHYISYPDFVEKADAKTALHKYSPEVVICSWPVANNTYEKHVFRTSSVQLYIVIGTKNPAVTGNFETYHSADDFYMEYSERLSSLILPPSDDNAVYIFRRKTG